MQSSAPLIKNLVRLSLLERVSPELLVRFLRPYEGYLAGRGVNLDGVEHDHAWVGELHRVLCVVDPTMPGALQQAFLDVADLASEQGHEAALNLAGERQLNLFGESGDVSPEDLAFRLYLEHADVFMATHARVQSQEARRFVDFFPRDHRPLENYGSESRRVLVVSQLRRWFAKRNRSEYVDLRVSETDAEVTFLIIHGRTPRNMSVITSAFSRDRLSFVPDKQDTVVFEKATGRLSINAQYPAENDFYRQVLGKVFFGKDDHFEPHAVLSCDVLLDDAEEALSVDGIADLDTVALREIALEACDHPYDLLVWKANDLKPVLPKDLPDLLRRGRTVRYAKLALYFTGKKRPKIVSINPPNKLSYDRRTGDDVVREFLFARGFLRHPDRTVSYQRALV